MTGSTARQLGKTLACTEAIEDHTIGDRGSDKGKVAKK